MATTQVRGVNIQDGTITNDDISASAGITTGKLAEGAEFLKRDGSIPWTGNHNANNNQLGGLANPPVAAGDAACKAYVDALSAGLKPKEAVRVATTANINLASGPASIDTIPLVAGVDRVLVKNQLTASANGLYFANPGAVMVRTPDADATGEINAGMHVFVLEGPTYANTGWVLITPDPITVGVTALSFTQFTGPGSFVAGNGLTQSGNTINVAATAASGITVNADDIAIKIDPVVNNGLTLDASGLRMTALPNAQILVGNALTRPVPCTPSGDVVMDNLGAFTVATTVSKHADFVDNDVPPQTPNGILTVFTLAYTPRANSEHLYKNGLRQKPGSGNDYTISGNTITFQPSNVPQTGDVLICDYRK